MTKRNELIRCSENMFLKLFLFSFLLQYSLGFDNSEGEYPAGEPAFYHFLEDGAWTILKKIPRGYMMPIPRVGRRQIREDKRQNMIPQPRIGREININDQLADIFYKIQKFLLNGDFQSPTEYASSENIFLNREYPGVYDDISENYGFSAEKENDAYLNKNTDLRDDISDITVEDSTNVKPNDDHIVGISYLPKKDGDILATEAKNSGSDISGDENLELIPLSHIGRDKLLATFGDKSLAGGLIAYPRLGRHIWEIHQALLPYPRAGRLIVDPSSLDYDIFLNTDTSNSISEDSAIDAFQGNKPLAQKRKNIKLIPRIGRKKRSVSDEEDIKAKIGEGNEKQVPESELTRTVWSSLDDLGDNYYFGTDKKSIRSKNAFVPRIGKKRTDYLSDYEEKRAVAFTPRIGRAALIPRIGRSDPRFRLRSRGAFVPRIGRRAALIPRIGRSGNLQSVRDGTD